MQTTIYKALRIKYRLFLVYHPETSRAMEYANQVIQLYLHVYITFSQDNWEDFLGIAQLTINNRVAIFVRISLFFITHGYNTLLLDYNITAAAGIENRGARTPAEIGNEITRKLREAFNFAQAVIIYSQYIQQ